MKGVCCTCQGTVRVVLSTRPMQELIELGQDEEGIRMEYGESIKWVCVSHDFVGQHCEGSGMIPQALVK